jgi:NTP pyrophosphatase (non-canonical NTP hydrolase)
MYGRVHAALGEKIPKPDLIVYLQADHDIIMRRIALRDRVYERDMDPEYIRKLAAAYEAWLSNVQDTAVLTVNVNDLDYLSDPDDLDHVADLIEETLAERAPSSPPAHAPLTLLQNGRLPDFQSFHRQLDSSKGFDPDLFFNYILLTEEVGEVASELIKIWGEAKRLVGDGRSTHEAHQLALDKHRLRLRSELADLLAYTLKLANYAGIDLEKAYLEKMQANIGRTWPKERTLPV